VTVLNNVCENSIHCVDVAAASAHVRSLTISGNVENRGTIAPPVR
jgi:hypothetical protein